MFTDNFPKIRFSRAAAQALLVLLVTLCLGSTATAVERVKLIKEFHNKVYPIIEKHCISCHDGDIAEGNIDLSQFAGGSGQNLFTDVRIWRKVIHEVDEYRMPPKDKPKLSYNERKTLHNWLYGATRKVRKHPGTTKIRRLSKLEFANTIRNLFDIDKDIGEGLPEDQIGEGFDNSVSPLLMEQYLLIADELLDELFQSEQLDITFSGAEMESRINGITTAPSAQAGERSVDGPGDLSKGISLPVSGRYKIEIKARAIQAGKSPVEFAVRLDNELIKEFTIRSSSKRAKTYRITTKQWPRNVSLSIALTNGMFRNNAGDDKNIDLRALVVESVKIIGPKAKKPSKTQIAFFAAKSKSDSSDKTSAEKIVLPFAHKAYRRPLHSEEKAMLMKVYDLAEQRGLDFSSRIKLMLKSILLSPQFIYMTPDQPRGTDDPRAKLLGNFEIASRLSYFLWATLPDKELFDLAHAGKLHDPKVLEAQARRMIADPRAQMMVENFAGQWLRINELEEMIIDKAAYPMMTKKMRHSMVEECNIFIGNLMRSGGSILEMLESDYTYMNELTAPLYNENGVTGMEHKKVRLRDTQRGGLMTMPAVLTVTSIINRTSPVRRGQWVLENLFDAGPPPPPPDTEPLEAQNTAENKNLTLREKMERHRSDPACIACHQVMDPIGIGFQNFDTIGRWRTKDENGIHINATGELPDGTSFKSPKELRGILMNRKDQFTRVIVSKLLTFALCRTLSDYDEIVVDGLTDRAIKNGRKFDDIIVSVITSYSFRHRQPLN